MMLTMITVDNSMRGCIWHEAEGRWDFPTSNFVAGFLHNECLQDTSGGQADIIS